MYNIMKANVRMVRIPNNYPVERNFKWEIDETGYIEGVVGSSICEVHSSYLIVVLGTKIVSCTLDAVEVILN